MKAWLGIKNGLWIIVVGVGGSSVDKCWRSWVQILRLSTHRRKLLRLIIFYLCSPVDTIGWSMWHQLSKVLALIMINSPRDHQVDVHVNGIERKHYYFYVLILKQGFIQSQLQIEWGNQMNLTQLQHAPNWHENFQLKLTTRLTFNSQIFSFWIMQSEYLWSIMFSSENCWNYELPFWIWITKNSLKLVSCYRS